MQTSTIKQIRAQIMQTKSQCYRFVTLYQVIKSIIPVTDLGLN
jgi:hypothetical protein